MISTNKKFIWVYYFLSIIAILVSIHGMDSYNDLVSSNNYIDNRVLEIKYVPIIFDTIDINEKKWNAIFIS